MINVNKYKETIYKVIGAAMEVHNELGYGLLEPIYNEALSMELDRRNVKVEPEKFLPCYYKNQLMKKSYRMDIVVEDDVIVELKSVTKLSKAHRAQLFNYMRLTKKTIGLLINFGDEQLRGERYVYDIEENHCYMVDKFMQPIEIEGDESDAYIDAYAMVSETNSIYVQFNGYLCEKSLYVNIREWIRKLNDNTFGLVSIEVY